jgi:hypothetical protein
MAATGSRSWKWQRITACAVAGCLAATAALSAQFTSFNDRSRALLEGNWQSCREDDGQYAERVYDGKVPGIGPFELHMGPYHEFALFRGVQDEHRDHASSANLLQPYNVVVVRNAARHRWTVAGLTLDVALAGGSRDDCESWFVTLRRATQPGS